MTAEVTKYGARADAWVAAHWPAIRARGRLRFVLLRGMLGWGGAMLACCSIGLWLLRDRLHKSPTELFIVAAALCLVSGVLWGVLTWHFNEKIFRQLQSSKSTPPR